MIRRTKFKLSIKLGSTLHSAEDNSRDMKVREEQAGNKKIDKEKNRLMHLGKNKPEPGQYNREELWKLAHWKRFWGSSEQQTWK